MPSAGSVPSLLLEWATDFEIPEAESAYQSVSSVRPLISVAIPEAESAYQSVSTFSRFWIELETPWAESAYQSVSVLPRSWIDSEMP